MQIKDYLKKKFEMLTIMSIAILGDVVPILAIMVGLWAIQRAAKFFGFENLIPIKIISIFSGLFMVILYLFTVYLSFRAIYKLFKDGEV